MTTERELLKYDAKACGRKVWFDSQGRCKEWGYETEWNPLTDSADCAAMCAKLEIDTMWFRDQVECEAHPTQDNTFAAIYSQFNNNREAAWRYASTMVAAKIGGMK